MKKFLNKLIIVLSAVIVTGLLFTQSAFAVDKITVRKTDNGYDSITLGLKDVGLKWHQFIFPSYRVEIDGKKLSKTKYTFNVDDCKLVIDAGTVSKLSIPGTHTVKATISTGLPLFKKTHVYYDDTVELVLESSSSEDVGEGGSVNPDNPTPPDPGNPSNPTNPTNPTKPPKPVGDGTTNGNASNNGANGNKVAGFSISKPIYFVGMSIINWVAMAYFVYWVLLMSATTFDYFTGYDFLVPIITFKRRSLSDEGGVAHARRELIIGLFVIALYFSGAFAFIISKAIEIVLFIINNIKLKF